MKSIIRKRRLRWLDHVWCMDKDRRANQVLRWVPEGRKIAVELDIDHQERLERPGNIMGEGGGAGNGQSRVEKIRCPMCRNAQDGLRSKVRMLDTGSYGLHIVFGAFKAWHDASG